MADLARIKRNVGKMVEQNAPEADIDQYISGEGVTLDQVRSFRGEASAPSKREYDPDAAATVARREKEGRGGDFGLRLADTLSFGAANPVMAGLAATGSTAYKAATGQPTDFGKDYRYQRDILDLELQHEREKAGGLGTVAEIGASLPFVAGGQGAAATGNVLSRYVIQPALQGGKYGAIYGVNSARGGVGEHLEGAGEGALSGAIFGPVFHAGVNVLARVPGVGAKLANYLTGRTPEQASEVRNRLADFADANIRPYGPAITPSATQQRTAEGLAGSVFGAPLRRQAQGSVSDAQDAIARAVRGPIDYQAVNDVGAELQGTLKRNLTEHSVPSSELRSMPADELSRITGPVDTVGFAPPRPKVEPIQPRRIDPIEPAPINEHAVPYDIAKPQAVQRYEANPRKINRDEIPQAPEHVEAVDKAERALAPAQANLDVARTEFNRIAEAKGMKPDDMYRQLSVPANNPLLHGPEARAAFDRLNQAIEAHSPLFRASIEARGAMARDQRERWLQAINAEHAKASAEAQSRYIRENAAATREAGDRTQANRMKAIWQAEAEARAKAQAETARLQQEANDEAARATAKAQFEADQNYQKMRPPSSEFEAGRTQDHTYPTEFSAGYETLSRAIPSFGRNPVGEPPKMIIKGVSNKPTATENLLNEFALDMRRMGNLPGYKGRSVYGEDMKAPDPRFLAQLKSVVGDEIAGQINTLMERRAKGWPGLSPQGMRDFITDVRRAKQAAQRPPYQAQPMPERAAALARLEGALREDNYRFIKDTGPNGERLVEMSRDLDQKYASYVNDMRRPLSKVFGEKVEPMKAMDILSSAAEEGNLALLRPYMRVMSEKGDPQKGAAAIVAHMTQNARSLSDFAEGYAKLNNDAKNVIFQGDKGKAMRQSYDRLARISERLAPYENTSSHGIDFTNKTNIVLGLSAVAHITSSLFLAGGGVVASKLLASPRYIDWMQRTMSANTERLVSANMARFGVMVARDSGLDADVKKAVRDVLSGMGASKAHAAPGGVARPSEPQSAPNEYEQYGDMIGKAAQSKGVDPNKSNPQDIIDAAWAANPSDQMADAIEMIAKRNNLLLPWDK